MRYSFKVWSQEAEWSELRDIWIEADRGGFWDAVWLNDHLHPPKADPSLPIMDAWMLFGGLAAITDRIRFGTMLSANTFRHPAILAKQSVTLDRMSDGRLEIGVGAGWHEGEHRAFGIELHSVRTRFELLDETLEVLHGLLTEPVFSFEGEHHSIQAARFEPKTVQKPRPPFVIGGTGPRRTIPLAAKWADQWNFPDYTNDLDLFRSRRALLFESCEEIGRDPAQIEVSVQFRYPEDLAETVDRVEAYRAAGADHILVSFSPPPDPDLPPSVAEALAS
ncbi:MAG: LLM class flavin-dependent oxidoreductase [Acidimicrobiia bacterium]|nr:LLM class flavin-dependent oxidoreductase [Acidimicrobiia bacterium]